MGRGREREPRLASRHPPRAPISLFPAYVPTTLRACIMVKMVNCNVSGPINRLPFIVTSLGYRPILDAMKTFAKSSEPIDIEVFTT